MSRDRDRKGKIFQVWKFHLTMTKIGAYKSNSSLLLNLCIPLIVRNESLLSATTVLPPSPVAYITTASLDKLNCTDYVDFGNCQDSFGQFSWSKFDSKILDIELKVFNRDNTGEFRLAKKLTMGEPDFNRFIRLRNQVVIAAENFCRKESLSPVLIPTMSKKMNEQI